MALLAHEQSHRSRFRWAKSACQMQQLLGERRHLVAGIGLTPAQEFRQRLVDIAPSAFSESFA